MNRWACLFFILISSNSICFSHGCEVLSQQYRFYDHFENPDFILDWVSKSQVSITYRGHSIPVHVNCLSHSISIHWDTPDTKGAIYADVLIGERLSRVLSGLTGDIDGTKIPFTSLRTHIYGGQG